MVLSSATTVHVAKPAMEEVELPGKKCLMVLGFGKLVTTERKLLLDFHFFLFPSLSLPLLSY